MGAQSGPGWDGSTSISSSAGDSPVPASITWLSVGAGASHATANATPATAASATIFHGLLFNGRPIMRILLSSIEVGSASETAASRSRD